MESNTASKNDASAADILKSKMMEVETQLKEKDAKYVYLYAEFENFKKRSVKERSDLVRFGNESFARDLLQVLDNLERALSHMPDGQMKENNIAQGLKMVLGQFAATFEQYGIRPMDTAQRLFDPNLHEAIEKEASSLPEGTILRELMKGYTIHGRLLRPARVVVSDTLHSTTE